MDSSKWLLQIINDILDISKIESGNMELEMLPFNLQDLLANCQSIIYPRAIEKSI
jgi:signal transduction histidine kinase